MSMQPDQDKIDASVRADHPFAPYITYEPTPYDMDLTDDPEVGWREFQEVGWREFQVEAEPEIG